MISEYIFLFKIALVIFTFNIPALRAKMIKAKINNEEEYEKSALILGIYSACVLSVLILDL